MNDGEAYYIIDQDDPNFDEDYSILKGPNDFCCMLGEPEDSNWYRDGYKAVIELNRLQAENTKLKKKNDYLASVMQDIRNCSVSEQAQSLLDVRAENIKLKDGLKVGSHLLAVAIDKQRDLESESAKLKKFARTFIKTECWGYDPDIDGGEVQEWAEQCGLIESHPATEQDAIDFSEYDIEVGDEVFKFTDILKKDS